MDVGFECPVCAAPSVLLGSQRGRLDGREFLLRHCHACHFSYVQNYRTDFDTIYNKAYYEGLGADPMVNYVYELQNSKSSIRNYEWTGVHQFFKIFCPKGGRWLDYGCGAGGMVNYAREAGIDAIGFEEGWIAEKGKMAGIPIIDSSELDPARVGMFDFVSAIEVFEHIPHPIEAFIQIRKLLKPGGILFVTTGNAQRWRHNLLSWDYASAPDVHVSFYEPETLALCMRKAGFETKNFHSLTGFVDIIKYKVLKNLRVKDQSKIIDLLPWGMISALVDSRYQVSKQPYGVAIE